MDRTQDRTTPSPEALGRFIDDIGALLPDVRRDPAARAALLELAPRLVEDAAVAAFPGVRGAARALLGDPPGDLTPRGRRLLDELDAARTALATDGVGILLAEDDLTTGTILEAILRSPGRAIWRVPTAREAREVIVRGGVDLALLDLMLPDGDGRDLLRDIRNDPATCEVPVIVLTGLLEDAVRFECIALGADDFATKPANADDLHAAVARQLARARGTTRPPAAGSAVPDRAALLRRFESWRAGRPGARCAVALVRAEAIRRDPALLETPAGEEILRRVGVGLVRALPEGCFAAHWGLGRFVAFGDADAMGDLQAALERLLAELPATSVDAGEGKVSLDVAAAAVWGSTDEGLPTAVSLASATLLKGGGSAPAVATPPEPSARPGAAPCLLVVEDDPITARLVQHRLSREGFEVVHFDDGQDAHDALAGLDFDLALLDMKLPGMDGLQLLAALRDGPLARRVPVVILSAMTAESDVVEALNLGADDYILKPFSPLELVARLKRQLHARRPAGG